MTPAEDWKNLVRRKGYSKMPPQFFLCPTLEKIYQQKTGGEVPYQDYFSFVNHNIDCLPQRARLSPVDWIAFYPDGLAPGTSFDEWGVANEPGTGKSYHMTHMKHPMAMFDSLEQFQSYPFPDYSNPDLSPAQKLVARIRLCGGLPEIHLSMTIWERAWYLRGMENLMVDMMIEDEKAVWLLDKVTDIACQRVSAYVQAGAEHVHLGDDVGTQSRLLMSEDMYRRWLKPRLAKVISTIRRINPEVIISYHSCGYVKPLINDWIELGIDLLHPVQPESMDFAGIHAEFGDRISFWGSLGTQSVLPFGSPTDIRELVFRNLDIAGKHGGLWVAPTHIIEPEVPWENVIAYVDACREYQRGL